MSHERLRTRDAVTLSLAFALAACVTWLLAAGATRHRQFRTPDDAQLRRWVRERVAHLASRPDAIEVTVDNGLVRVSGPIAASELQLLLSDLTQVHGVRKVYNALDPVAGQ